MLWHIILAVLLSYNFPPTSGIWSAWVLSVYGIDPPKLADKKYWCFWKVIKINVHGKIHVNGKVMSDYFKKQNLQTAIFRPLTLAKRENEFDVRCSVKGGGLSGQAGAIILGISKALISHDELLKKNLKKDKLTTRDSRVVERKKYGHRKARRSFQFSKR